MQGWQRPRYHQHFVFKRVLAFRKFYFGPRAKNILLKTFIWAPNLQAHHQRPKESFNLILFTNLCTLVIPLMPPSDSFFFKCQNETNWNVVNVSKTWIPSKYTIHNCCCKFLISFCSNSTFFIFQCKMPVCQ